MQYLLALYDDENVFHALSDADMEQHMGAYMQYTQELRDSGAFIQGEPLMHSRNGSTVRQGGADVQDGPFADTKEQLGGFYLIEAKDLDEALDWAAKCPCAQSGTVEVRPAWNIGG